MGGVCLVSQSTSLSGLAMKRAFGAAALGCLLAAAALAQDMMRDVDLSSPDMVSAEMTRAEVEAALAAATVAAPADFTRKRLSGLDLSGLDLSGAVFRAARLNKTKLVGASSIWSVFARTGRSQRDARARRPRPGMAARSGPHGCQPEGRKSVRLADASRPARRRRSLARA